MGKFLRGTTLALALFAPAFALAQQPAGYLSPPTGSPVYVNQNAPLPVLNEVFSSTGSATLSAGTTSANVALPAGGQYVEVANGSSTVDVYVAIGVGSGTAATTSGYLVKAGRTIFLATDGLSAGVATYIAGITASSTASLTVTSGTLAPGAGENGGGSSNVAITSPLGAQTIANSVAVTQTQASHVQCAALCTSLVAKASAGTLYSFNISADSTLSGAAWWVLVYDATSKPADGSVTPAKCYAEPSGLTADGRTFDTGGVAFTTGIAFAVSTTGCFTSTSSTHAFIAADIQ